MDHENIVPLLGITSDFGSTGMVSPWMEKGNLTIYLKMFKNLSVTERLRLVSRTRSHLVNNTHATSQLCDIVAGLVYRE